MSRNTCHLQDPRDACAFRGLGSNGSVTNTLVSVKFRDATYADLITKRSRHKVTETPSRESNLYIAAMAVKESSRESKNLPYT